jgi:hypothetical protein
MQAVQRQQESHRWPARHRENPGDQWVSWRPLYARRARCVKQRGVHIRGIARTAVAACALHLFKRWSRLRSIPAVWQ